MNGRKDLFGIPVFETLACIVIAGCVIGVLASRIETLLETAEKTSVETTVMNIRSGLNLEKAQRIAAGKSVTDLAGHNPLDFLQAPLVGQSKENLIDLAKLSNETGWYYESSQSILSYKPARGRHLKMLVASAEKLLQWKIVVRDSNEVGVQLMTPYQWF